MGYSTWSSEEESKLLSWQGTVKELAAILGRSENSIRSKSKKLGKYFNTFPQDTDTQRFCGMENKFKDISLFSTDKTSSGTVYFRRNCRKCEYSNKSEQQLSKIKDNTKSRLLIKLYGISALEFQNMKEKQQNLCFLCRKPERKIHHISGEPFSLSVDHSHKSGKVRSLLCAECNLTIGKVEKLGLTRITEYLNLFGDL